MDRCWATWGHNRLCGFASFVFTVGGLWGTLILGLHNADMIREGALGANLTRGSQGNMILTLMPSTPCLSSTCLTAMSTYSLTGSPEWIIRPSTNFMALAPM